MPPLVSVVVTTRNEEAVIANLLQSLRQQTYPAIEIVLVDNNSTDATKLIASRYVDQTFNIGPERSAQRNYGVERSRGEYVLLLDADMELEPSVVSDCVDVVERDPRARALVIPEVSFGESFWARCKALERSCYVGDRTIEAARFFDRGVFLEFGGYDTSLTGPEDWDLPQRIRHKYGIGRCTSSIRHNEGRLTLRRTMQKKRYYARTFARYALRHRATAIGQANLVIRPAFFKSWRRLIRQPRLLAGMIVLRSLEMAAAGLGFLEGTLAQCATNTDEHKRLGSRCRSG